MKKTIQLISLLLLLSTSINSFGQDFDAYIKHKNDNYSFPTIPNEMNFQEFYLLSQTFRMQDMMYAAIVPGYIHFKAQEKKTGYNLLAINSVAYATLSYEYIHYKNTATDSSFFFTLFRNNLNLTNTQKIDSYIIGASLLTLAGTYLFDIIHGKYILEKKQEEIRFKFSIKNSMINYYPNYNKNPGLNFGICVYF